MGGALTPRGNRAPRRKGSMGRPKGSSTETTDEKTRALLVFTVEHVRAHGRAPSYREAAARFGYTIATTQWHGQRLVAAGLVVTTQNRPMRVTEAGYDTAGLGRPVWLSDDEREAVEANRARPGARLASVSIGNEAPTC